MAPNLAHLAQASSAVSTQVANPEPSTTSLAFSLVLQIELFAVSLLPLLLSRRLDGRLWGTGRGTVRLWRAGAYTGVAAAIESYTLNAALISLSGSGEPVRQQLLETAQAGGALLLVVIIAVIVAPVTEEIIFRGVRSRALPERFGGIVGVLGSTAIFAGIHIEVLTSQPLALRA